VKASTRTLSAASLSDLWTALTNSGTREAASVLPKFTPAPQYEYDEKDRVAKAVVIVVEEKEMPEWKEADAQCPPIKAEWTRYFGVLDAHEGRHLDIDRRHFTNVHAKLVGKKREDAWAALDAEIAAADAENQAYDTRSANGVNEGANINTAVQCAPEKVKSTADLPADENRGTFSTIGSKLGSLFQAKLAVSHPGDPLEREADTVADQVVRGEPVRAARSAADGVLRRACAGPGQCDCVECREEEERRRAMVPRGTVQRHAEPSARPAHDQPGSECAGPGRCECEDCTRCQRDQATRLGGGILSAEASRRIGGVVSGAGEALDSSTRGFMEARMGHDFSRVRIHSDAASAESAAMVKARAYTLGPDIVFGYGQYAPGTADGRRLLAHELAHVVQQGQSRSMVLRDGTPSPAPAPAEDPPAKVVRTLKELGLNRTNGNRDTFLRACMEAGGRYDEVAAAWKTDSGGGDLLQAAQRIARGTPDAARVYAYLRFGQLRLADKLFFAGIDAGTDKETIWRLLPAVKKDMVKTNQEFTDSYSKDGPGAFGAHYTKDAKLPDGVSNKLAGFLAEEADDEAERVKFNALLVYGELRPVDEIKIAIESVHLFTGDIMAGLDKLAKKTAPNTKPDAVAAYKASYDQDLGQQLKVHLGEKSSNAAKATHILEGTWTPRNRILWACEGAGTNMKEIWAALDDAQATNQLEPLKKEWDEKKEIYQAVTGELAVFSADVKRIEAILENKGDMLSRIAQLGLTVDDTKPVLKAVLEREDVEKSFREDWPKRGEKFWKDFTQDGKRATVWGDAIAYGPFTHTLSAAIAVDSEEGILKLLANPKRTDGERKAVREDLELTKSLQKLDSWSSRIEMLLAPKDDLRARADYLRARFEKEAMSGMGLGASAANAYAFEDEYRALDVALGKAKDPHNLTPDERKQIDPLLQGTEEALESFIRIRDEMDAVAIQVVGAVAGLLATAATGGAAGPVVGSLLARAALAQGCASVASVWAVKGERITGAEGLRAFATGAAGGAVGAWAASPVMARLSPEFAAALKSGSREVAEQVATKQFSGTGLGVMKGVVEGGVSGVAGSAVDSASQQDTWRFGFIEGLKKVLDDSVRGGLTAAATGGGMGVVDYLKVALFSGGKGAAPPAAGDKPPAADAPPPKVEAAHVERARIILEAGGDITFARWQKEILPAFGGHAPVARQALGLARRQMLQNLADQLNPVLKAKGVELRVPETVSFDGPVELNLVPLEQSTSVATDGAPRAADAQATALDDAAAEVHKKLGPSEGTAGIQVKKGPTSKSADRNVIWEVQYKLPGGETHELKLLADGRLVRCSAVCQEIALMVHSRVKAFKELLKGADDEAAKRLEGLESDAKKVADDAKNAVAAARKTGDAAEPPEATSKKIEQEATAIDNKLSGEITKAAPALKEKIRAELTPIDQLAFDGIEQQHGLERAIYVFTSPLGKRGPANKGVRLRRNVDGPTSLGAVKEIAQAAGVSFPKGKEIRFRLDPSLDDTKLAWYREDTAIPPGRTYSLEEMLLKKWDDPTEGLAGPALKKTLETKGEADRLIDAIVISLHPAALESNEAIAAAIGHEMHEINGLLRSFEGGARLDGQKINELITPPNGLLHVQASALELTYIDNVRNPKAKTP
jgi:hypothetical protein